MHKKCLDIDHSLAFELSRKVFLLILLFYLFSFVGTANGLDRDVISKNENVAIELSKVWELDSIKRAVKLFEQTAEDWEKLTEPQKAAFCLNEAAKLAQIYYDHETSFRALKRAIIIEKKYDLLEEETISSSLYALFLNDKSDKNNSRKLSEKAFLLSDRTNSVQAKAYSHFCKGIYEYYYGKIKAATDFFEQAQLYAQETQDIFIISQTLFYVGYAYIREGYSYRATDKMNLALQLCKKFDYKKGLALSYFGLATSYYLNEKQKALDYFKKSESLFPANFEWMEKARIATAIGNIYMDLGEFELAESNFQKAIPNYEKANYLLGKITTLTLLADTYSLKTELMKARQTYKLALELTTNTNDKFRFANIKEGLGNVEFKGNNFDSAIKNYLQALQLYNDIGVRLPGIENLIGSAYQHKRDYKKARGYYSSALKTTRQTKDFLILSETLFNLSKLELVENSSDEALNSIKESITITDNLYSDVANTTLKSSYFSTVFERYELFIQLLMKKHKQSPNENYAIEALQATERSRARVMLENLSLSEADFTKDADAETVRREKEIRVLLNAKADKLIDLLSQNAEKSETDKISVDINELEYDLESIKSELKQKSPIYSAIKNPPPFDVAEFQQNILDENSLLLEFSFGIEESYLWLVGKTEVSSYVLPPRAEIETYIENLRAQVASREIKEGEEVEDYQKRISEAESNYQREARELSNQLFGQIADKLSNKRLIIVPDGKLHYFPVSALPLPNSASDDPILLTNETVYEPSAQTLSLLAKSRNQSVTATKDLLVFSDPIFTTDDARFSADNKPLENSNTQSVQTDKFRFVETLSNLTRLPASKDESDSIIKIIGASESDVFSGFRANREQLLNVKTGDYKILHFATHGLTNEQRPELSGIILSRFDEKGQKLDESFRIHDIYGLNLNADLVVLSACETGIGKEVKGEGLMSLNNAFLQTGAKSVMASLWKVEDGATLELMKTFYGAMKDENLTPSQALRQAQIKLRRNPQYQSPFYWAAFTVQGDFRNVPKLSGGSRNWVYLSALIPFGLIGIYLFRKRKLFNRNPVSNS